MRRPRVLLADDHRLVREAFAQLLESDCDVVGAVADGHALLAAAPELRPDIVVLDIAMPLLNGLAAARQLVLYAARRLDAGHRADMEAGMAKLFASEAAMQIALDAMRIHGGYGYSTEFDIERYFRDAPLMIVGEGTNEIQRNVIARQLVQRHPAGS